MDLDTLSQEIRTAHRLAMEAKHKIFEAQDAIGYPDSKNGEKVRKELAKLRNWLEAFDRALIAMHSKNLQKAARAAGEG